MQILVVEDETLIAMDIEALLTDAGHTVRGPASTAALALELAELSRPDLALVNINLRDGHGAGIGLARELLDRWGVPSLFISGKAREAAQNSDAALGHLKKPYRLESVLASVEVAKLMMDGQRVPETAVPRELTVFRNDER